MPFNFYDAIVAGLWATTALTGFLTLSLALGYLHLDFGRLLGGIFWKPSRQTALKGLGLHYLAGLVFGLCYAAIFAAVGVPAQVFLAAIVGMGFGIYHWILSMPLLSLAERLNPSVRRGEEPAPGIWGINYGPMEAFFRFLGHLAYGTVFGFSYAAVASLNGTAAGGAAAGNGVALLLALVPAAAVFSLYAAWLPADGPATQMTFQSTEPSERETRQHARHALRARYDRGEITWEEYQRQRRRWAAEP